MVTTEIASLSIKAGDEKLSDASNNGAQILAQTAKTLLSANGCQRVHMGNTYENECNIKLMVDWESHSHQEAFLRSQEYGKFLATVKPILAGKPVIFHVDFDSQDEYNAALSAPATEIVVFHFGGPVPAAYTDGIHKVRTGLRSAKGYKAFAWGPTYETDIEYDGITGQAAVVIIGWESVDAHMHVRETPIFTEIVPYLRSSSKKAKMEHVEGFRLQKA